MTLALALVANIALLYLILKYAVVKVITKDLFGNKARKGEVPTIMFLLLGVIFIAVGFIEILSILFRPVSLTFRLFEMFLWRKSLHSMLHLVPQINWLLPVPLLHGSFDRFGSSLGLYVTVSVYIGLICNHDEGEHH